MSDDFFSSASARPTDSPPSSSPSPDTHDDFAHAISLRFGSADLRTARLLPGDLPTTHHHPPSHPPPSLPPPHPPTLSLLQVFSSLPPSSLAPYLTDSRSLILDIRPHAAHAAARVNNALSLSVPTTLLKRPLFSLSKLSQMLPSPSSRARFADWSSASSILVYDSDSAFSPDNSIIAGLLRKFRAEGFTGELGWVRGGFQAVWRETPHFATTELPPPEEDDHDLASSSGALRTTHLPKAAFSLSSTTAVPPLQLGANPGSHPLPNSPAPSAFRAANPFFDTIRQNIELSHGVTERIPLRLPRRVRRRIHDLPFPWLQDIARRSALRRSSVPRHPSLDRLGSGSESSDDPHTSDPDENDPSVEEGTETLAMQFYRIELAEQRRLRSIMEHHARESEFTGFTSSAKPNTIFDKASAGIDLDRGQGRVSVQTKSAPGTPHPAAFPFSITAGVEKGTKNRYTHIWPFEHARVRLHDARHQGSHPGRREKARASEHGRSTRDRSGGKGKEKEEQGQRQDKHHRSRSNPAFGESQGQEVIGISRHSFCLDTRPSISGTSVEFDAGVAHPKFSSSYSVPRVKIEYDATVQDSEMLGPPTPATAFPLSTPFYTPMEAPMRAWPSQLLSLPSGTCVSPGGKLGGTQFILQGSSLPSLGPLPSFPLRLPNHSGGVLPSIGEQTQTLESPSSSPFDAPLSGAGAVGEAANDTMKYDPWIESPVDDYVNASYVQPLGTHKRYIATQGPLPSTYVDFWTLVWEQNVHVIVMLTREVENAVVKCGSYWTDTEYGPLRLELLHTSPLMSPSTNSSLMDISEQGFSTIRGPPVSGAPGDQLTLITRTFALTHTSYPGVPPRRITHLQYLDWSDMNVPEDPRGVLDLVRKVEQAVAESTPSPSPSRSLSPGSGSGSLLGGQSPEAGSNQKGWDTSLLSPTSAGTTPGGGKGRCGNEWRHSELDSKTGIAAFALGKTPPVLLHCSAGVGRTGGFIAVDAVLDGIKRDLRKNREEWRLKKPLNVSAEEKAGMSDVEASGGFGVESTETGVNASDSRGEESVSDNSGCMDVDKPTIDKAEKTPNPLHMINTVPIHVSAGDRTKGRRRQYPSRGPSGEKQSSSSESLVVHVPYAGNDDVPGGTNVAGIDLGDPREVDWQSSSTRQWVEQVSDQTRARPEEGDFPPPPPPSIPSPNRERSLGSTSCSSGPSAFNPADDSMNGSASANGSGSASGSGSGSGNRVKQESHVSSATGGGADSGSGSRSLPPFSVSKPGSWSISFSNSCSGTGTGSLFGTSSLRVCLRDSSVTSISTDSTDSLPLEHELKLNAPIQQPSAIPTGSSSDMEIDCPPRFISVPLQPTYPSTAGFQCTVHSRHDRPILEQSPVASSSSSILPPVAAMRGILFLGTDVTESPTSRPNSDVHSDELPRFPQEFESGEGPDAEDSGKKSQVLSNESEELAVHTKLGTNLRGNTKLGCLKAPETLHSSDSDKNPLPSRETEGGQNDTIPLVPHVPDNSAPHQFPVASEVLGASEHNQLVADYPVIDYKLPRELHDDLSPPLISSLAVPICMVIQDMREQRMSLCQSLRQYVFVHAAIIEGALRIVDEERELWSGTSDDASPGEGEPRATIRKGLRQSGHSQAKAWFRESNEAGMAVMTSELEQGNTPNASHPLHTIARPLNYRSSEGNPGGGQVPLATALSSSRVSSSSKGKRGPSPTELFREDRTGALSLNKRPSIHRKTTSNGGEQFLLESNKSSPVAGESEGTPRDAAAGVSVNRSTPRRPTVPEKGSFASVGAR